MGNAVVIINHPTSLDHGKPVLSGGKVTAEDPGMIHMEREMGMDSVCGGVITFKRIVKECGSIKTVAMESSTTISAGASASAGAKEGLVATASTGIELTDTENRADTTHIQHIVSDKNEMSELECKVNYLGKNRGEYRWLSNDLNLKAKHRWSTNSEMFIKITFREDSDTDTDSEYVEDLADNKRKNKKDEKK